MARKLRMGMVGGGKNAFIGAVHRYAAQADGGIELVCGALSSDPKQAIESGRALFLDDSRIYTSYREMFEKESQLPENIRMDFVSIVTPNHIHFEPAVMAIEKGFNVMIEKPITFSLEEAIELKKILLSSGKLLGLTHTYTGYPLIKQAREMVRQGKLGKLRKVYVNYHQGWLSKLEENEGNKQAAWRTDPSKSGKSGAMGDIGVHAFNLAEYITGRHVTHVCADLNIVVRGRALDDDGAVLLKFDEGVTGVLTATQIATGEENDLNIKIFGDKGGLEWHQMVPNTLTFKPVEGPVQLLRTGMPYLSEIANLNSRIPPGHPEGYLEAFANIYRNFAQALLSKIEGKPLSENVDYPGIEDGVRGMAFIDAVVKSSDSTDKWIPFEIK